MTLIVGGFRFLDLSGCEVSHSPKRRQDLEVHAEAAQEKGTAAHEPRARRRRGALGEAQGRAGLRRGGGHHQAGAGGVPRGAGRDLGAERPSRTPAVLSALRRGPPALCKAFFCAAATKGAKCDGNPCTCTVQVQQLSKSRTKRALNRYRPPKPREMFVARLNEDGDVVFDIAPDDEEASAGWPYDTIARRATEENDDEA